MKPLLLPLFIAWAQLLSAQFSEDFSQYSTAEIPNFWTGNTPHFIINSQQILQLKAPAAGTSTLLHKNFLPDSTRFTIDLRLEFAPSTSNQLRIFLFTDNDNLLIANGYFIEIGETGNDDAIRFFRQNNGQATLLASGRAGAVAADPVDLTLEIEQRSGGRWRCQTKTNGGSPELQFQVTDPPFSPRKFKFGCWCKYTATRREAFFFKKIAAETYQTDVVPPRVLEVDALADSVLRVVVDERLALSNLQSGNFAIHNWTNDLSAKFDGQNSTVLVLHFAKKIIPNQYYQLKIKQLEDLEGNISNNLEIPFLFRPVFQPQRHDLIFNEIMADPNPPVALPDVEWVEIFNRSGRVISLENVTFGDASTSTGVVLPAQKLLPNEFLVLVPAGQGNLPTKNGRVVALPNFPSLNNDTDFLWLKNANGEIIDAVQYHVNWHSEAPKRSGGWSLERRNPTQPCLGSENWGGCIDLSGGTPGATNSLETLEDDEVAPKLLTYFVENAYQISLHFSEGMDATAAENASFYNIQPPLVIQKIEQNALSNHQLTIFLKDSMVAGEWYDLFLDEKLMDCAGNPLEKKLKIKMSLPQVPENQDIVISEIMFDPPSGGSRFLEIFNRSDKMLDTRHLFVADFSGNSPTAAVKHARLFPPKTYFVLTNDTSWVAQNFEKVLHDQLLPVQLPTFNEISGNVTLFWAKNQQSVLLDSFNFSRTMHNALLNNNQREGVSLEKIRLELPSQMPSNWTSAAQNHPFLAGTPTQPNSQSKDKIRVEEHYISLAINKLSPDGDGRDDFLEILYQLPQTGFAATFSIFSADGILLKHLKRQELLGTTGVLRWDGETDNGSSAKPGIYILWVELYHPDGRVQRQKLAFSVVD